MTGHDVAVDVVVVGGGPAGAAVAAGLAGSHRVLVVERGAAGRGGAARRPRLGETLPGAAARLLRELGVWDAFHAQRHARCHARLSRWGGPQLLVEDGLRDLDGPGWSLDREAFDGLVLSAARSRGAVVMAGRAAVVGHGERGWSVRVSQGSGDLGRQVHARFLVDASGRGSRLLRPFGPAREVADRLVCVWTHLPVRHTAQGTSYVESAPDGWWFTAPVPGGDRVVAFHTDPDVVDLSGLRAELPHRIASSCGMSEQVGDSRLDAGTRPRVCAAGASRLASVAGPDWLAVGDAAMAFDPLSSQGLFHALYTGVTSARAVEQALAGDAGAMTELARSVEPVWAAYRQTTRHLYGSELRWADRPFWRNRTDRLAAVS